MKKVAFLLTALSLFPIVSCNSKRLFNREESDKRIVFSCTNKTNTSYAGIEAHYEEDGITINLELEDNDLYAQNIYDIGLDDNIEFIIGERIDSPTWVANKTFHFLINGAGKIFFQTANGPTSFGPSLDPALHVVLGENLVVKFQLAKDANCAFGGFTASIYLAYDVIGTDKEHGFNNLSISPAMRNTHAYSVDTEWAPYTNRGCSWSNPKMFVPINGNNEFKY